MNTTEKAKELLALMKKATRGWWRVYPEADGPERLTRIKAGTVTVARTQAMYGRPHAKEEEANAEVITALRNAAPALLARLIALEEVAERRNHAEDFLAREGYRRCDIPACNCPFWHGSHASQRLSEIHDALVDAGHDMNGVTILGKVKELAALSRADAQEVPDAAE